ncbi:MAG TPA: O-antigen ligase family protein [Bacteroidia bacterium]|nr:O-antigen ligase family protein [Bacteroidia bacterium]
MAETLKQFFSDKNVFWTIILSFFIVVLYGLYQNTLELLVIPFALFVVYLAIFHLEKLFYIMVALIPLAINLSETSIGIGVSLPTEPIAFGIMLLFWLNVFVNNGLSKKILFHPVTLVIVLHLVWMLITSLTSTLPLVSLKYTLARFCFVTVFYFVPLYLFQSMKKINQFIWSYMGTLTIVILYSIYNQSQGGFSDAVAHHCMTPFYNDHTAYAAAISFLIPIMVIGNFIAKISNKKRGIYILFSIVLITAVILSYTRASWIGIVLSLFLGLVITFRIPYWVLFTIFGIILVGVYTFQTEIVMKLGETQEQSSNNLGAHVQSASNITSDASNVERLNRWSCVLRMHELKPWLGWGPGTFQFVYAPFQKESEKTIISTNFGTGGNAHSEYLGPLAEQGYLGTLFFLLIVLTVFIRALQFISTAQNRMHRLMAMAVLLGLVTYWVHGFLNNFLDTDKLSVLHWGFIAMLVAIELLEQKEKQSELSDNSAAQ